MTDSFPYLEKHNKSLTVFSQQFKTKVDWEFGISRWKLVHTEWINNRVQLYSTGNYILYLVIKNNKKEYDKEYIYVYN